MDFREFVTKNVYRNIKAYFAYFLSSSISATLLFSFTMIIFHPDFAAMRLPQYLEKALNMTTVIAYLFLCFFVF
jgi:putative ABC transport system permease protein